MEYSYDKFLYFNEMNCKKDHLLMKCNTKKIKDGVHEAHYDIDKITRSIQVEIGTRMFYAFKEFHRIPHGSHPISKWDDLFNMYQAYGNDGKGLEQTKVYCSSTYEYSSDFIKICYPGSYHINEFDTMKISHQD